MALPTGGSWASSPTRMMRLPGAWRQNSKRSDRRSRYRKPAPAAPDWRRPLSRPIIATVGIIAFVQSWNSYIIPLIMLNTENRYPWPLGIMVYKGEFATEWQLVLAFITLTILPTIIAFFIAQKHIIAGLTAGAVKS